MVLFPVRIYKLISAYIAKCIGPWVMWKYFCKCILKIIPCSEFTPWGRVTHICVSKLSIIGSDDGLSPDRRQTIIWTNDGLLLIGPLGTNFSEIVIEILTFSSKKMRLEVLSAKWRPFCLGLNVLTQLCYQRKLVGLILFHVVRFMDYFRLHTDNIQSYISSNHRQKITKYSCWYHLIDVHYG